MRRGRTALVASLLVALPATAGAHGEAPAALEVLAADDVAPTLIRTNIGVARRSAAGEYSYLCPGLWGGAEKAIAAASPDAELLVTLGDGGIQTSTDAGCSFDAEALGLDGAWAAGDAAYSNGAVWVVGQRFDTGVGGAVWSVAPSGERELRALWSDARPDSVIGGTGGSTWVAGARPTPHLFRAQLEEGSVQWTEFGAPGVPEDTSRLSLRWAGPDQRWVVASVGAERYLWRGESSSEGPVEWTQALGPFQSLHGPVEFQGLRLVVGDGELFHQPVAGADSTQWQSRGETDWICLQAHAGRVYACTLPALLEVEAWAPRESAPQTKPVFALRDYTGPSDTCGWDEMTELTCRLDWFHFGAEAGLLVPDEPEPEPEPDSEFTESPEDEPASDVVEPPTATAPEPQGSGGCQSSPTPPGWWALWLLGLVFRRQGRRIVRAEVVDGRAKKSSARCD